MLNIAICDDDIQTTGRMEMKIEKIAKRNFIDSDIDVFGKEKHWWMLSLKGTNLILYI